MKWKLSRHPKVHEDLAQIHEWIAIDNPVAADRVIYAITDAFQALRDNPGLGTEYRRVRLAKLSGIRMLPVGEFRNYVVFYKEISEKEEIRILYVFHGSRDISQRMNKDVRE